MSTRNREADGAAGQAGDSPLLRALVREAERRGDTLKALAKALGVTYEHLAQWRRGESSMTTSRKSVHARAAAYLGLPLVLVMVLAGQIGLREFVWPAQGSLRERIQRELEGIKSDPYVGAFAPPALEHAAESVQLFVIFLCRQLIADPALDRQHAGWLTSLQRAVADVHGPTATRSGSPDLF